MKTKKMPIVEVSIELKEELDELFIISDTHRFYKKTGQTGLDEEIRNILKEYDEFSYQSQLLMYLVSTKNYVVKPKPTYYIMYGLNCSSYYVTKINPTIDKNVYVAEHNNEKDAFIHANSLNKLMEENK